MVPPFSNFGLRPMTRHLDLSPHPPRPTPAPLVAVDRAMAEFRRGGVVAIRTPDGNVTLAFAAEAVTGQLLHAAAQPALAVTARRAGVLGLADLGAGVVEILKDDWAIEDVAWAADPCACVTKPADPALFRPRAATPGAAAAVALAKLARLLPAALIVPGPAEAGTILVEAADIDTYQQTAARTLRIVSEARVPLKDADNARIVAFRPSDGGIEHLAIVIGEPDPDRAVLARLHSECFTGDLLGSLRCDCGDQLRGAIAEIAQAGSGVLLYLAQEGRGIGLVNKLRAYRLQDEGFDTLDANLQLGFDDDERIYQPAAQMLRLLGVGQVRLMTNNPMKVDALARHGIDVEERVPHVFPSNDHNEAYLRTKATRGGHLF